MIILNNQTISFIIQAPIPILIPFFVNNLYKLIYTENTDTKVYSIEFQKNKKIETNKYTFISMLGVSSIVLSFITNITEFGIGGGFTLFFANINYWNYLNRLSKTLILATTISTLIGIKSLLL